MKRKYSIKIIKKNSSPKIENMKFIDTLTNQIDEINNTKYYLLKSYERNLKKSDRKYNKFKWKKIKKKNNECE